MTRHTCVPHRCWPSRLGWGTAAFLATYLIFMHSTFFGERAEMWGKWRATWDREWQAEQEEWFIWQRDAQERIEAQWEAERVRLREAYPAPRPIPEHTRYGQRWGRK